ncbi:12667_t:CDS:2, partial [Entrophospora sp. SA101]
AEIKECSKKLLDKYSDQEKKFNRERKDWDRESIKTNNEIQKLHDQALEVADAKITAKNKDIKMLQDEIKSLKGKLVLSQEESLKKESEISSLKSNLAELERIKEDLISKVSELEHLKLVTISRNLSNQVELPSGEAKLRTSDSSIIGGGDEGQSTIAPIIKNIANFADTFAVNKPIKDFSKFLRKKNMDKNDTPQLSVTINKVNEDTKPRNANSSGLSNMKSSTSNADISQIVETKDFSEEAISKTDFIGNDQSYATKTKMAEILPIGALGLIIWNKEKSTKSKSENGSDRSKISGSSDDGGLFGSQESEEEQENIEIPDNSDLTKRNMGFYRCCYILRTGEECNWGSYCPEGCEDHWDSPRPVPCEECGRLTGSKYKLCILHAKHRRIVEYYRKELEKLSQSGPEVKEPE